MRDAGLAHITVIVGWNYSMKKTPKIARHGVLPAFTRPKDFELNTIMADNRHTGPHPETVGRGIKKPLIQ